MIAILHGRLHTPSSCFVLIDRILSAFNSTFSRLVLLRVSRVYAITRLVIPSIPSEAYELQSLNGYPIGGLLALQLS